MVLSCSAEAFGGSCSTHRSHPLPTCSDCDYRPLIIPYALLGAALSLIPKTVLETFDYPDVFVRYSVKVHDSAARRALGGRGHPGPAGEGATMSVTGARARAQLNVAVGGLRLGYCRGARVPDCRRVRQSVDAETRGKSRTLGSCSVWASMKRQTVE